MMKRIFTSLMVILALVILSGTVMAEIPDLIGNWTGKSTGYLGGSGFIDYPEGSYSLNITDQKERFFGGYFVSPEYNNNQTEKVVAGVISSDGTTFYLSEKNEGFSYGKIISPDEIELTYIDSTNQAFACIDYLHKTKNP